jgi:hypothetical protein
VSEQLVKQLRAQRESWVTVAEGVRIKIRRPSETQMAQLMSAKPLDVACNHCVDWDGVTQALLLGDSVGSSDPVPFTPELWAEVVGDRVEWVTLLAEHVHQTALRYLQQKQAALGN